MTVEELVALFDTHADEFLHFERVDLPPTKRADLCAFLLLDRLVPGTSDLVCSAEHDEIWLETDLAKLASVATEADVVALIRCGVRYDEDIESLAMFA